VMVGEYGTVCLHVGCETCNWEERVGCDETRQEYLVGAVKSTERASSFPHISFAVKSLMMFIGVSPCPSEGPRGKNTTNVPIQTRKLLYELCTCR